MNYSAWQIGKLVQGLLGYRALKAKNGKPPSWEAVRDALLLSKATVQEFPVDGSEPKLKAEALRRFAAGNQSSMESEKLDDLVRFLVHEGLLGAEEISSNNPLLAEAIALHSQIAISKPELLHQIERLAPLFTAWQRGVAITEYISLRVVAKPMRSLYLVEEECYLEAVDTKLRSATVIRQGYAFIGTSAGHISMFLKGADRSEILQYVQVQPISMGSEVNMHFIRLGGPQLESVQEIGSIDRYLSDIGLLWYHADYPDLESLAKARGGYFL